MQQAIHAPSSSSTVLLIDDQSIVAEMLELMLFEHEDISFMHVADAQVALEKAISLRPSVVLVDLKMPLIDGFGVIRQFRAHPEMDTVPMILLSSEESADLKVRGFAEGANDYLVKWPDKQELIARIRYHSGAYQARKERDNAFLSLHESRQDLLRRTQELADSQAALHHAQKMEAIGKLTGGVAHDFNNVLQIISGNLQLLRMDVPDNERAMKRINSASEGVNRGAKLASQLLAFARRQPLQPVVIEAGLLVIGINDMIRRSIGSLVDLHTVVSNDIWNIHVDPNQLENVILNLAINARDAMQGEGKLTIRASNLAIDRWSPVSRQGINPGEYVLIEVADTGVGMSADVLERVFEPFFTTKPAGQGTGLGLSMAYGFVKQSGGHIDIESQVGIGTTVRIYLPRADGDAIRTFMQMNDQRPITGGPETILVVEDEPEVRETTVEILNKLGYQTLQAGDAQSALDILRSGQHIDLLFSDVVMPGPLRSAELALKARECLPEIVVLFASGYADSSFLQDGKLESGVTLLSKPYSGDELARKIRHLLRDQRVRRSRH